LVDGLEVDGEGGAGRYGDDAPGVLPDVVEEACEELASLGGVGLCMPEGGEVAKQLLGAVEVGVGGRREALQFFLKGLAAHDVAGLCEVAEDVEVLEAVELSQQLAAALLVVVGVALGLGGDRVEHELAELLVGLEGVQPVNELLLQRFGLDDRLVAVAVMAAGGALVATDTGTRATGPMHPRAAALAAQELAQQVLLGWPSGLQDAGAPGADLLHLVEQLVGDDRLVQPADAACLVAQPADVSGVGGVAEHLPDGVLAELPVAGGARAGGVQPVGEGSV
jgi:hypothetical protein